MQQDRLRKSAEQARTILCFGIDPKGYGDIYGFFTELVDTLIAEQQIAAIKPNYAYFAQYGFDGLDALKRIIDRYRNRIPIILDAKRGDIGKSSEAYAREAYDFWQADAVTISPYMGGDSIKPFLRDEKTAYLLCRTSNAGAKDFQELKIGMETLYEKVAEKAVEWGCGLVVGATSDSIKKIVKITENKTPLLIPGIGTQGGDLHMVLGEIKGNIAIHRINASSSIAYAYEKQGGRPADAALREAKKLNEQIRKFF